MEPQFSNAPILLKGSLFLCFVSSYLYEGMGWTNQLKDVNITLRFIIFTPCCEEAGKVIISWGVVDERELFQINFPRCLRYLHS